MRHNTTIRKWVSLLTILIVSGFLVFTLGASETVSTEIFVDGGPVGASYGIDIGMDGNLYVASVGDRYITVLNPETGEIVDRYGPEMGVESPDDLVFGSDGTLYWTAILTGEVGAMTPDGETFTVAQLPPGVNPIAESDDGRLFVGLCLFADAIYEVYPDGSSEPRLIQENEGSGCAINGMEFGADGLLYGPRLFEGRIIALDVDTGDVTTVADGFNYPTAVAFDSQGQLYVTDHNRLVRVNIATGEQAVIRDDFPMLDNLAFTDDDRLFVTTGTSGFIYEVFADGDIRIVVENHLAGAAGVAVLNDLVYVGNPFTVESFDTDTATLVNTMQMSAMTISSAGDSLYFTSWLDNSVHVWNPETEETHSYRDFAMPVNSTAFRGDLIVLELGTSSVVRINLDDTSSRETLIDGLAVPAGIATDDDAIWISDWATGIIWQVVADGEKLEDPLMVASDFVMPEGLAVTADNTLLIVETGTQSLIELDLATGAKTILVSDLAIGGAAPQGMVPSWTFNGVAVDSEGAIFVSGELTHVLYKITR